MKINIKRERKGEDKIMGGWDNPSSRREEDFRTLTKEWLWTAQQEKKKLLWFFVGLKGVEGETQKK